MALGKFLGTSTDFPSMDAALNRGLKEAIFSEKKIPLQGLPVYLAEFFPSREGSFFGGGCAAVRGFVSRSVDGRCAWRMGIVVWCVGRRCDVRMVVLMGKQWSFGSRKREAP